MKQKFLTTISLLSILVLSACGGTEEPVAPEISAEDLASTAVAQAWLAITQTAAAMPTATSIPPTFTPQPTNTPLPTLELLPTLPPIVEATATPSCIVEPYPDPKGTLVNVEFYNQSGSNTNLSFGMNFANDKNECFAYSFTFGINDIVPTKVLAGCYYGWAWVGGTNGSIAKSGDKILCLTDTAVIYKVVITEERVDFK